MKSLFRQLFKTRSDESMADFGAEALLPPEEFAAGQVYSFRTTPYSEFAPPKTDRYGALKILGTTDGHFVVAVLGGIWPYAPSSNDTRASGVLEEHRFAHTGRPAVFGVQRGWWMPKTDLTEFKFVGTQSVSPSEQSFVDAIARHAVGTRFASIHHVNYAAEGEWRWSREREKFVEEIARRDAKNQAQWAAKEERYRIRLRKLTWDQLLSETPFANWSPSPPFPSEDFTLAARKTVHDACIALRELGPKPRKVEVRAILKSAVVWFNDADEKAGGVIETEEREDISTVLEEMAYVARQKSLVDEIDEWREW